MTKFLGLCSRVIVCVGLQEWGHDRQVPPPEELRRRKRLVSSIVGLICKRTTIDYILYFFDDCSEFFLVVEFSCDG